MDEKKGRMRTEVHEWDLHLRDCVGFGEFGEGKINLTDRTKYEWAGLPYADAPRCLDTPPQAYYCKKCGIQIWTLDRGDMNPSPGSWAVPGIKGYKIFMEQLHQEFMLQQYGKVVE